MLLTLFKVALLSITSLGSLFVKNNEYKESKADSIPTGYYSPRYDVTDEYLGVSSTDNTIEGRFTLTLNNFETWYSCNYLVYNTRESNYALFCYDTSDNVRSLLDNGVWSSTNITLNIIEITNVTGDIGFVEYYLTNGIDGLTFNFNIQFNYNAPYNSSSNDMFIKDSFFTVSNSDAVKYIDYDLPFFVSNDETFNRVRLIYQNGIGLRFFKVSDNSFPQMTQEYFGYFFGMAYVNSFSNLVRFVCYRNFGQYADTNNNLQSYLTNGVSWVNSSYQRLQFVGNLTVTQINSLTNLNNNTYDNNVSVYGGNVSLATVFSLINTGFAGLTSLFGLVLLPGLTLGTLVLVPFIVTLLIFVAKLFKR